MKHIKHWLMTVAVLLCSVTMNAQSFEVDGIFYNVTSSTDLTAEVVPCVNNKYEGSIVIPSQVSYLNKEYTVTRVGDRAFSSCGNLSSITLPNTVTSIGSQAFYYCKSLTSITIPTTVKTIEFRAFADCSNLTSINIPSGVTRIEQGLFYGCSKLKAVTIPSSVNTIDIYAFRDCSNLSSIVIPKSVTSIGDEAFSGCTSLTSVTSVAATPPTLGFSVFSTEPTAKLYVPKNSNTAYASAGWNSYFSSIAEISGSCGANLTWTLYNDGELIVEGTGVMSNYSMDTSPWAIYSESITKATIKEGVTTIGDYAFQGCRALTSASLPTGLTSIGKYAFQRCEALVTINIPTTVVSMGTGAFYYCSLTSLTLPEGIKNIEQSTFTGNEFTSVVIPQGVTVIGVNSFCDCKQLESVTIPNSVQTIGEMAFQFCPKLASVTIPNSVVTIERYAFDRCSSLATLSIGEGVTNIGKDAFSSCSKLEYIICSAVTPPIIDGSDTFYNVNRGIPVYVPKSSVAAYQAAGYWSEFTNIQAIKPIVSSITLSHSSITLTEGETLTITATIAPNDVEDNSLTWSSSDEKIVSVDGGAITALAPGTAIITATANDESGVSASCKVIVKEVPRYTLTYLVDGEVYYTSTLLLGETIVLPETPTKKGHTFSGWSDIPETMPAENVTIRGTFSVNSYTITYIVDGEVHKKQTVEYGAEIIAEMGPTKGGYTFSGWSDMPSNMPDKDITVYAMFTPNKYTVTFKANGEVVSSELLTYGTAIVVPDAPEVDDYAFVEWADLLETVPAYDVEFSAVYKQVGIKIVDGIASFEQDEDVLFERISYTRTLPNLHWNPLYVPFEIPMTAEFLEDYDVAYFNDIHSYDEYIGDKENGILGADGEIDRMSMEVLMVQEGATLNANYPYLIRAKNEAAKALNITATDATLYETVETTISCSSVFMDFEVTGSYSTLTSSYLDEDYRVIISTGSWGILSSTSKLRPFRIYLKMTARGGSPVKVHSSAMKTISIQVGNEDDTTSIEDGQLTFDNSVLGVVYDLQGRQVKNSGKGIYIVNGKKTVFK